MEIKLPYRRVTTIQRENKCTPFNGKDKESEQVDYLEGKCKLLLEKSQSKVIQNQ